MALDLRKVNRPYRRAPRSLRRQRGFISMQLHGWDAPIELHLTVDTTNYVVNSALPEPILEPGRVVVLLIDSGVTVYSTSTGNAAIDCSTLPAGTTVIIVNNGSIFGMGGAGGNANGGAGQPGGPAIKVGTGVTVVIHNANGTVGGGGGGGGAGTSSTTSGGCSFNGTAGGGGGGAGRSKQTASGGTGAASSGGCPTNGSAGGNGTSAGAGGGGAAGTAYRDSLSGKTCTGTCDAGTTGVAGAAGGTWGTAGSSSTGGGGAAGLAVQLAGGVCTVGESGTFFGSIA